MKNTILSLFAFALLFASMAMAQTNTSVVEGRVADPSGGVIRDCSVALASLRTGGAIRTQTNETGIFVFPAVPVGSYTLKVVKEGFRTYELSDFRVTVEQRATLDVQLELGPLAQSVTIEAGNSAQVGERHASDRQVAQ